jgi:hypothetical protein
MPVFALSLRVVLLPSVVILEGMVRVRRKGMVRVRRNAEKAFDKLNHEILFNKLYRNGIEGNMWVLLRNMYREMTTQVKWDNHLSENIYINQGIQQGA